MYCGEGGEVVLCEFPQCRNVICLVSEEHPRGCLLTAPPTAFECAGCCRREKKCFPVSPYLITFQPTLMLFCTVATKARVPSGVAREAPCIRAGTAYRIPA